MKDKCRYPKKKIICWLVHGLAVLVIRSAMLVHANYAELKEFIIN